MPPETDAPLCGLLNLHKPTGVTSRDVVDRVSRPLRRLAKAGHAGTLDPLASGVLVVCVGPATRLIEYVQAQTKGYRTVVRLGARSDTLDADGHVVAVEGAADPGLVAVRQAVAAQLGTILQKPPEYSALKVAGKRAYDLARAGEAVDLAPRPVTIHAVEVLSYAWPLLELAVSCEGGTYIRSIARDVGDALGVGGLVDVLVRTRIGPFTLEDAVDPLTLDAQTIPRLLRPAAEALAHLPPIRLSPEQVHDVARGRALSIPNAPEGDLALFDPDGHLVAVGKSSSGRVQPTKVLIGLG